MFRRLVAVLCMALIAGIMTQAVTPAGLNVFLSAQAASKTKLNKTKAEMMVGTTLQLNVSGTKSKVTWSSSNKKVAKVSKKGLVTAVKAGKAKITAKVGKKKLTCNITVKKTLKGDISSILGQNLQSVNKQLSDKLRYFQYCAYTNDYFLVETDSSDSIISVSLLTDAETGIGKYTLFGLYPGMTYRKATNLLSKNGWKPGQQYSDEGYFYSPSRPDVTMYLTIIGNCIDLISYLYN